MSKTAAEIITQNTSGIVYWYNTVIGNLDSNDIHLRK